MTALTPAQREIWAGHRLAEDKSLYNTAECLVFDGKVDAPLLGRAVACVVAEVECLDSTYRAGDSGQGERVRLGTDFDPRLAVFRFAEGNPDGAFVVEEWAAEHDLHRAFDLETHRPCRFTLLRGDERDTLYMSAHHVALDGFGYALVWERLLVVYAALRSGEQPPPCPFPSMAEAFGPAAGAANPRTFPEAEAVHFWREKILAHIEAPTPSHAPESLRATTLSHRMAPGPSRDPNRETWAMPAGLWADLLAFAKDSGAPWTDAALAALALLASYGTGERKQLLGFPVLGRAGPQLRVPCMQMNIVPLPMAIGEGDSLRSLSLRAARERKESRRFHGCRHETIQRHLRVHAPGARAFGPVVNILPFPSFLVSGNVSALRHVVCAGPVVDLTVVVRFESFAVPPVLEFLSPRQGSWGRRPTPIATDFEGLLSDLLAAPDSPSEAVLECRRANERAAALLTGSEPVTAREGNVVDWILEEARADPGKVAIVQGNTKVTYGELARTTERWAGALAARGLAPNEAVGVLLARSPRAVLALLAILRAGGTYVPLDPEGPRQRRDVILRSAAPRFVLVDEVRGELGHPPVIETPLGDLDSSDMSHTPAPRIEGHESACALFTSGSTGTPKGVVIGALALGRFTLAAKSRYGVVREDTVLQFAPLHFDASLEEILVALASGATLLLRDAEMLASFGAFADSIDRAGVTILDLPTAYWSEWVEALGGRLSCVPRCVRVVILGGEAVAPEKLRRWLAVAPDVRLVNSYGPTEATIVATTADLGAEHLEKGPLPIGTPLPGVAALVLDEAGLPSSEGELVLLGPTLALRYLGSDAPLRVPLRVGAGVRDSYRTGDLVSLEDGRLRYLGRADGQLKVSGQRVHPGEIEAALLRLPGVRDCCVVGYADPKGRTRLAAFLVHDEGRHTTALRAHLASVLPQALVPSVIEVVDRLPRTSTGKIDRGMLAAAVAAKGAGAPALGPMVASPALSDTADLSGATDVEPSLLAQTKAVWAAELGLPSGSLDESTDFFEAGGHSLLAIGVSVRLSHALQREVLVSDVLGIPRLGDFCRGLSSRAAEGGNSPVRLVTVAPGRPGARRLLAFPGLGAGADQFASLARELGDAFAFDVVQARLDAFDSMESLVAACVALLDRDAPKDGHLLLGHSFGGRVAFEVARALEARGDSARLCLLDTYLHLPWDREASASFGDIAPWMIRYVPSGALTATALRVYARQGGWYAPETLAHAKSQDDSCFAPGGVVRCAPGDHFSMLSPPNAGDLARIVQWI